MRKPCRKPGLIACSESLSKTNPDEAGFFVLLMAEAS
jgi:hypothetical protein